jgi:hypothetical protein
MQEEGVINKMIAYSRGKEKNEMEGGQCFMKRWIEGFHGENQASQKSVISVIWSR